jgi:hypothetical protein
MGGDFEQEALPTFGAAIRAKLAEAGATSERWTSWKEQTGWIVKVEFAASDIDHDARWGFDPRRSTLSPLNADAIQLSRQGSLPEGLIPRLRALDHAPLKDESRFDSGAFGPRRVPDQEHSPAPEHFPASESGGAGHEAGDVAQPISGAAQNAAIKRAPETAVTSSETADLLEALRRRRGQREPLPGTEHESERDHSPVALFDALEPGYEDFSRTDDSPRAQEPARGETSGRRRGRTSMPSWDEIVFGARTDEQ